MSNDVLGDDQTSFLLYWGYFDLTARQVTFSSVPDPRLLTGLLVHHAFASPEVVEFDWDSVEFVPVPEPTMLFRTALTRLPARTAHQAISLRAFCRFEFFIEMDEMDIVTADVDWIVIDKRGHWYHPDGERVVPAVKEDYLRVSDFLLHFDIGPDARRSTYVQSKLDSDMA